MKISGLQKTTLLDFPGHVACTIFTGGCNFRCPFCHNSDLLDNGADDDYTEEEVFEFLHKRKRVLEGVCITGGEPTLQPDLEDFIRKVRELGLAVKLDTNGYKPELLKDLCQKGLLDYVAMDIKASRDHYGEVAGAPGLNMELVDESIAFLLSGITPYEFRTTVVRGLHTAEDFRKIGPWIKGCPGTTCSALLNPARFLFLAYILTLQKKKCWALRIWSVPMWARYPCAGLTISACLNIAF